MLKKELRNSSFVINIHTSIQDVMGVITDNQRGSIIVIDDDFIFQGVISDGDIRRALLKGATQLTPISKITNISATTITKQEIIDGKADDLFKKENSINILPVVDEGNKLVDLVVRNPKKRKMV